MKESTAAERVGTVPGHGEGGDPSGRGAGDGTQVGVGGEVVGLRHLGKDLLEEEPRVAIPEAVVLEAAVVAGLLSAEAAWSTPG